MTNREAAIMIYAQIHNDLDLALDHWMNKGESDEQFKARVERLAETLIRHLSKTNLHTIQQGIRI